MVDVLTRVQNKDYLYKLMTAEQAAALICPNDTIGVSGFTPAGHPKAVPLALAKRIEREHFQIDLWAGASVGDEIDGALAAVGGIRRRYPYQDNADLRRQINGGTAVYADLHLGMVAQQFRTGFFGKMDVAVVEAVAITAEGDLILGTSVGMTPTWVSCCDKVIVEVNVRKPMSLAGLHDIYELTNPPHCSMASLTHPAERIGSPYLSCGWDKIAGIVLTDLPDIPREFRPADASSKRMGEHIIRFFEQEVEAGRLPRNLLPLQSGVGSVANAVLGGLAKSSFQDLSVYTEILQDGILDLIDEGKVIEASGTAIAASAAGMKRFYENIDRYSKVIVLRPQELSNHPGIIRQLGVIALNTAVEFDLYGNVNSTHLFGSKVINGIGGSSDYARNAFLNIFCTSSIAKAGAISSVVPLCSHIDHTEHDVQVVCTEQGLADLRGLCPRERAEVILEKCVHPSYRKELADYWKQAVKESQGAHEPISLEEAFSWHQRFRKTGTMQGPVR